MKKVFACIFWFLILALMSLWTYEFYRVRNGFDPKFTFSSKVYTYDDGITTESIGLGYKVFKYERSDLYGTEFVSIFGKQRKEKQDQDVKGEDTTETTEPSEGETTEPPVESDPIVEPDGGVVVDEEVEG